MNQEGSEKLEEAVFDCLMKGPQSVAQLCVETGVISTGVIHNTLDVLAKKGFVERREDEERKSYGKHFKPSLGLEVWGIVRFIRWEDVRATTWSFLSRIDSFHVY